MDLFEVLSMDERVIVFSSEEDRCLYTWNQSVTLQCWQLRHAPQNEEGTLLFDDWEECGVQTLSAEPRNFKEARDAAKRWYFGVSGDKVPLAPPFLKRVIIDQPCSSEETAKLFGISKKRQRKLDKMVKEILKDEKKTKKRKR